MKRILLLCCTISLGVSGLLLAQDKHSEVTVFLKNGRKVSGRMLPSLHESFITIEHDSLSRTNLAYHTVKKIHFGRVPAEKPKAYFKRERGFFHLSEIGLHVGDNNYNGNLTPTIHTVNGYAFSPYLMTGLGIGLDRHVSVNSLPLYASVRGIILHRKVSPFYFGNIGGSWVRPTSDSPGINYEKTQGGLYLHTGIGYQINVAKSAFVLTAGYKQQQTEFVYTFEDWQGENRIEENRTIRRFVITFGYTL
ncbi:hypothetical protein [Tunicatimonas pelagia]|uniref:hypothetical protein n=1 Tax=Tunicatimonas pelagia TaxID=931531 RepID=UPI002665E5E4|nr:hypothetical protein [Tunicatimonas pelagia]WKN43422.1 hypothetical protein P0M28_00360 [Tunicatimonas pelagia]